MQQGYIPSQNIQYQIFEYQNHINLNPKLYDIVNSNLQNKVQGEGNITNTILHKNNYSEIDTLLKWIESILPQAAHKFSNGFTNKETEISIEEELNLYKKQESYTGGEYGFDINGFKIDSCWGILFNMGEALLPHNHFPFCMSFCYYVNAPEGSPPLIIDGDPVNTEAGKLIIFYGHQTHFVPPCFINGRCSIVGNVLYSHQVEEQDF